MHRVRDSSMVPATTRRIRGAGFPVRESALFFCLRMDRATGTADQSRSRPRARTRGHRARLCRARRRAGRSRVVTERVGLDAPADDRARGHAAARRRGHPRRLRRGLARRLRRCSTSRTSSPPLQPRGQLAGARPPLATAGDFARFAGKLAKVKLRARARRPAGPPRHARRQARGDRSPCIVDGKRIEVPFADVVEAHLVFELDSPQPAQEESTSRARAARAGPAATAPLAREQERDGVMATMAAVPSTDTSLGSILEQVAKEKGIDKKILVETIEAAILKAAQSVFGPTRELEARFNEDTGQVDLFQYMTVVEDVAEPEREIARRGRREAQARRDARRGARLPGLLAPRGRREGARAGQGVRRHPQAQAGAHAPSAASPRRPPSRSSSSASATPSATSSSTSTRTGRASSSGASFAASRRATTSSSTSARPRASCRSASRRRARRTAPATASSPT